MASTVSTDTCDPVVGKMIVRTDEPVQEMEECGVVSRKPSDLIAKHMNGKQNEWTAIVDRDKPLVLLDLPDDILQAILREITHTNDLTALALTHSSLHDLVIPHIYSRFDIVWPEANTNIESRIGVDALTYGLATLVMASDVFGEAPYQQQRSSSHAFNVPRKVRRGNHFARYTKKFSLGNGPVDWVQEYLITKEGGKMLGTLVALAVGRMRNLEAFIWDMPTGVLRDVWLALASLGNRDDGQECRLEKVWVRWHDNTDQGPLASPPPPGTLPTQQNANIPSILAGSAQSLFQIPPYPRVEFPTFSILPPLKSLSVLDVDELPYAEEMSVLIERSMPFLRELRVGIAQQAQFDEWTRPSEDRAMLPPTMMSNAADMSRPGGVLGIIFGRFCEPLQLQPMADIAAAHAEAALEKIDSQIEEAQATAEADVQDNAAAELPEHNQESSEIPQLSRLLSESTLNDDTSIEPTPLWVPKRGHKRPVSPSEPSKLNGYGQISRLSRQSSRLQLEIFEIERIHLSIHAISRGIDWSQLIQLTILGCRNHELLWKELRKKFTPASKLRTPSSSRSISTSLGSMFSTSRNATPISHSILAEDYPLKLRRLHTDCVSPALIAFIKDTLAPDSLEWLFLQESTAYKSTVGVDMLYKGAIRRQRGSLKKLLIDSEVRKGDESIPGSWKRWICNRELLTAITSGKMQLRELSMSIDYKDWHFFLQRLPNAAKIRSLHIAHISEHVHGTVDAREAALQVLDIVSLRPDMELCYLGVQRQCFEVLEYTSPRRTTSPHGDNASIIQAGDDSEDNEDSHDEHLEHGDSDFEIDTDGGEQTEDEGQEVAVKPSFRLREILFYDDKVSIFKARHGRL